MTEWNGLKIDLEGGREVGLAKNDTNDSFMFHFAIPLPEGVEPKRALRKHRKAKIDIVDGKVVTQGIISREAFSHFMQIGLKIQLTIIEEEAEKKEYIPGPGES